MSSDRYHEHHELIANLCLEAGRIMEVESPALAMTLPVATQEAVRGLANARQAGEDIAALAAAAQVLLRRGEPGS